MGKAAAIRAPIGGAVRVTGFLLGLNRQAQKVHARVEPALANGHPAARQVGAGGLLLGVLTLDIAEAQITAVRNQINPDKLRHLGVVGHLTALLSSGHDHRW